MTKKWFLPLHKQASIYLTIVSILIVIIFEVIDYFHLRNLFYQRQEGRFAILQQHLVEQFQHTISTLNIVSQLSLSSTADSKDTKLLMFDAENAMLDYDIITKAVYTKQGVLTAVFGDKEILSTVEPWIKQTLVENMPLEEPYGTVHCNGACYLFLFAPIMQKQEESGAIVAVVAVQLLTNMVVNYQRATGTHIAFVTQGKSEGTYINDWNITVRAQTDAKTMIPFLTHLSQTVLFDDITKPRQVYKNNKQTFMFYKIPTHLLAIKQQGYFLLSTDVSEPFNFIEDAFIQGLLISIPFIGVLVFGEASIIRRTTSRLETMMNVLPSLASKNYHDVRTVIQDVSTKPGKFHDEIDTMCDVTTSITSELEAYTLLIEHQTKALQNEKDFIDTLFKLARALIITMRYDGTILSTNDFTTIITGYNKEQLLSIKFNQLLVVNGNVVGKLQDIFTDQRTFLEHEAEIVCNGGTVRTIVWNFTRIYFYQGETYHNLILAVGHDITERLEAQKQTTWLALHDSLTGLDNRHRFVEELNTVCRHIQRTGDKAAILFFDVDRFKDVNDTDGHAAGDALLKQIASETLIKTRSSDTLARFGGDEFAILLRNTDENGAIKFAEHLIKMWADTPFCFGTNVYNITISIGIALIPQHGLESEQLLICADTAMYAAKKRGRGKWHLFDNAPTIAHAKERRILWKEEVSLAISEGTFLLYLQPVLDIKNNNVTHHEVLLRLWHNDRILYPKDFIPAAERAGLSYIIDNEVIRSTVELVKNTPNILPINVNLSTAMLSRREWVDYLTEQVKTHHLNQSKIVFEITETAAISDLALAKQIMKDVTSLGFAFAIDDFGVGFASFGYLKHLPVNVIKIDSSFISSIALDDGDSPFVASIVTICHGYGKKVVAEGVEDEATLQKLKELGVDYAQGYHIGKPEPSADVYPDK